MKKFLSCFAIGSFLAIAGCGNLRLAPAIQQKTAPTAIAGWKVFRSEPNKFAVSMPGTPKETEVKQGPVKAKITMLQNDRMAYAVLVAAYQEAGYSAEQSRSFDSEKVLASTIKGFVESSKGKIESEKNISLQGQPGKEVVIAMAAQEAKTKVRVFYADGKIYQAFVVAPTAQFPEKNAKIFLDSFTLLK